MLHSNPPTIITCINNITALMQMISNNFINKNGMLQHELVMCTFYFNSGGGCLPYPSTSVLLLISQVANNATNYRSLRYSEELAGKIPIVHIKDVCRAHIFCAETLSITGRFLCASSYVTSAEIAKYYLETFPQLNQEYLEDNGREIEWGSRKLEDKGFAYKHSTETILDDSLECVKRPGII
ncbi:putative anthocyanidin reductase ((2R,3R)-flavan-3-ol-forming) [Helianthus anomalus]